MRIRIKMETKKLRSYKELIVWQKAYKLVLKFINLLLIFQKQKLTG